MNQIELMKIVLALKPGECIDIPSNEFKDAVGRELTMLDRMSGVREEDITKFITHISLLWGVAITRDRFKDVYILMKPNKSHENIPH